jgi:uncharacterized RDD family membrane protein YckC
MVFGVYFVWCWHKGQTLAMKTWRLQLVNKNGNRLSLGQAIVRYLLSWVWFGPPLALAWVMHLSPLQAGQAIFVWIVMWAVSAKLQRHQQFWHDVWAKTYIVVYEAQTERPA